MDTDNPMFILFVVVASIFIVWLVIVTIRKHRKYKELSSEIDRLLADEVLHEFHVEPFARNAKMILQYIIGIGILVVITIKLFCRDGVCSDCDFISPIIKAFYLNKLPTLEIVGLALAYSTAIDLAYTLFTPSLDEAINPLITGLAAALLIFLSKSTELNTSLGLGVILFVLAIAGLLIIRKRKLDQ